MAATGDKSSDATAPAPIVSEAQMRTLRIAVIAMGAILLMGFAVVIGRIVYLLNRPGVDAAASAGVAGPSIHLPLPSGAIVKGHALSGGRMTVHYESPAGAGIAIVDLATGRVVQRIEIVPQTGR